MLTPLMRAISTLPLLVAGVFGDDENPPFSADDLSLLAHRLDRRSYFHARSLRSRRLLKPVVPQLGSGDRGSRRYRAAAALASRQSRARAQRAMLAGVRWCVFLMSPPAVGDPIYRPDGVPRPRGDGPLGIRASPTGLPRGHPE